METAERIRTDLKLGNTSLGIEFGSTRIKTSLIDCAHQPIASGSFAWENRLEDGVWMYQLEDAVSGVQDCYADLVSKVYVECGVIPVRYRAIGLSGMTCPPKSSPLEVRKNRCCDDLGARF